MGTKNCLVRAGGEESVAGPSHARDQREDNVVAADDLNHRDSGQPEQMLSELKRLSLNIKALEALSVKRAREFVLRARKYAQQPVAELNHGDSTLPAKYQPRLVNEQFTRLSGESHKLWSYLWLERTEPGEFAFKPEDSESFWKKIGFTNHNQYFRAVKELEAHQLLRRQTAPDQGSKKGYGIAWVVLMPPDCVRATVFDFMDTELEKLLIKLMKKLQDNQASRQEFGYPAIPFRWVVEKALSIVESEVISMTRVLD